MNDTEGDTGATPRHLLATLERLLAIHAATVKGALDEATEAIEEALGGDPSSIASPMAPTPPASAWGSIWRAGSPRRTAAP